MNKIAPSAGQKLPPLGPGGFRIVTKNIDIEKSESTDGLPRRRFKVVMSSTIKDRRGDEIKPPALLKMRDQFREGRTIFMDHDHAVGAAFGTSDYSEIVKTDTIDPETGQPVYDLIVGGGVNEPNAKAANLADSLEGNYVKYGASIGVQVTKHKRNEAGAMDIWDVDTLEGSIVGIPMNQRSWVTKALEAIEDLDEDESQEETMPPKTAALDTDEGAALQVQGLETQKDDNCDSCGDPAGCDCSTCDCSASVHNQKSVSVTDLVTKGDEKEKAEEDETAPDGQAAPSEDAPETASTEEDEVDESDAADQVSTEISSSYDPEDVVELAHKARTLAIGINERDEKIAALEAELVTAKAETATKADELREAEEVITKLMTPRLPKTQSHTAGYSRALPDVVAPEIRNFLKQIEGDSQ